MSGKASAAAQVAEIIDAHADAAGACLPILHGIQERLGYVPSAAIPQIAEALNLSRAEVHGVVSFYKDFRSAPPGRHVVRVCRAEACQSVGGNELGEALQRHLGVRFGETTSDGAVTLESVFCLGNCALSPALTIDERLVGKAESASICAQLDRLKVSA